jgi:hypothetical protein
MSVRLVPSAVFVLLVEFVEHVFARNAEVAGPAPNSVFVTFRMEVVTLFR